MSNEVVVMQYESRDAAERALHTLRTLDAEGFLKIQEAAIVARDADGEITAKPADEHKGRRRVAFGGASGLVVGGLIGIPVLGILAGAGIAAKRASHAKQLEDLVFTVGDEMEAGAAALVLAVTELNDAEAVSHRLEVHQDALQRVEIPDELQAEIDAQLDR